ncbi:hypothetical protein NVP1205O_36 [Vibrio phage 1.205.O._10N.222.51.A7]|nr:hypothetical protein NVP1205O_36 [Vibrio phage 1.205.O._10N.222.51.A7]
MTDQEWIESQECHGDGCTSKAEFATCMDNVFCSECYEIYCGEDEINE